MQFEELSGLSLGTFCQVPIPKNTGRCLRKDGYHWEAVSLPHWCLPMRRVYQSSMKSYCVPLTGKR